MEKLKTYSSVNKGFNARGELDYRIILFVLIHVCLTYQILEFLGVSVLHIIYILFLSMIPMAGIYFTVSKEQNIIEILSNIFKYLFKNKIYIYKYENRKRNFKKHNFKSYIYGCKNK